MPTRPSWRHDDHPLGGMPSTDANDLDSAIQRVTVDAPESATPVQLTAVYHNLLRRWAEL